MSAEPLVAQKKQRARWCSKCLDYRAWGKVRVLGARAGFRACLVCGSRTSPRKPVKFGGKKKRPPSEWKVLRKQADELWRNLVKRPQCCAACGKTQNVVHEAAHGFSRIYDRTRWLLLNGWDLCSGCHVYYTRRPEQWTDWMIAFWARTDFVTYPAPKALELATEKHQEMKRLAYSSETNPIAVPELREIVEQLKRETSGNSSKES